MDRDILGIDFGTTNSKMAYMLLEEPVMIENIEGKKVTPSIVYFKSEDEVIVGELAKRNLIVHPDSTERLIYQSFPSHQVSLMWMQALVSTGSEEMT
jgi:molecular chaperone DnaK